MPVSTGHLRILVVDEHDDSADLLRHVLGSDGHDVVVASGFAAAVRAAAAEPMDLLVTELALPDGCGWSLYEQLWADRPVLSAVAVSALAWPADRARSRLGWFAAHLTKPIDLEKLRSVVRDCAGERASARRASITAASRG